jgi:signal transduction histidine kinase
VPRFRSLMSWIIFLHVVVVVATAALMPLILYWFMSHAASDLHNQAMQKQAEAIAGYVVPRADGEWTLDLPRDLRDLYSEAYGRYSYAVIDESGRTLFASRSDRTAIFQLDPQAANVEYLNLRRGNKIISGASVRKELAGKAIWIQVAEDLAHQDVIIDDIVTDFFQRVGWVTLPILLILLAIDILIFRRAMLPVLNASEKAQHISPAQIDVRIPSSGLPSEIQPLVTAINGALDRLEKGFQRQREFTADAAHELRTPLAVLRTRIETLPDKRVARSLHDDIERMSRVVGQLLDSAELDTFLVNPGESVDLHEVCAEVAELLAPLALTQGKSIAIGGMQGPIWIRGNAEMLHRAVRNLVENALHHTPAGTAVEIELGENGEVSVLDRGRGIPAAEHELIFQRFWRGNNRQAGGAGLGLSIVKRIVEVHGGTISVHDRPAGGAQFSVKFVAA